MRPRLPQTGFTIMETIVGISIISLITLGLAAVSFWGSRLWNVTQDHVKAQDSARAAVTQMTSEIREMQISDNGSHPINTAQQGSIIFYANVDSDTKRERVRYALSNDDLIRGIIKSDASQPPQYPIGTETVTTVAQNIRNTDIFEYYDDQYTGSSAPLTYPIDINQVRLIKVKLLIDYDPTRTPTPLDLQTNITLRNLKDNL